MTEQKKPKREKQKAELRKQARLDGPATASMTSVRISARKARVLDLACGRDVIIE